MSTDLISKIRRNRSDEGSWTAWYKSVYPKLSFAAFRLTNGNAEAARDLTQETFARFLSYRAIEKVQDERHALAYLLTICRNLAMDRNAEAHKVELGDIEDVEKLPAQEQSLDMAIDFDKALSALESEDQEVMRWARDGETVSEIARRLGISYTAAGVRVHRLKKQLLDALGSE